MSEQDITSTSQQDATYDELDRQADEIMAQLACELATDGAPDAATQDDQGPATADSVDDPEPALESDPDPDPLPPADDPLLPASNVVDHAAGLDVVAPPLPAEPPLGTADKAPRRRRWPTVLLACMVLLLGAYLAGVVGFMRYFMPHTTLNGTDVSLKPLAEVAQAASDSVSGFSLAVIGDGLDITLGPTDIKARYDGGAFARSAIKQQHPWAWPLEVLGTHALEAEAKLSYDAARLDTIVGGAVDAFNKGAVAPVDAKIAYNKKTKRYEVEPEKAGTRINRTQVLELVRAAIGAGEQTVELDDTQLETPTITADDPSLTEPVARVNASLDATQELVHGDKTVATVGVDDIAKWVKVADDLTISFDEEACTKWCRGELSEKIDTIGSKRSFKTPDGRELTVSGGTYGWSINGAELAQTIADNVRAGKQAKIELTWLAEAKTWNPGGNEWGDTFVEIDLAAQHVRYFKDGKVVWETDCVSGGPMIDGKDRTTPQGVYYINSNMRSGDIELKGEIDPKTHKPSYISHVKYWMPFIGDSVALHDADWRSSFGGEIYKTNGSHGCVNLPPDKAADLYGMVSTGTVVITHY